MFLVISGQGWELRFSTRHPLLLPGWERQGHLLTVLQVASMQIAQQEAALLPLSSGESLTLPWTSSHTSPGRRRRTVSSLAEGGYSGSPRGLH